FLVDSTIVNKRDKSYLFISREYDSLSICELTSPKGIAKDAYYNDTIFAYLNIVPYIDPIAKGRTSLGNSGGPINDNDKVVYYMQLITDVASGELLYYDKSVDNVVLARDWKRFQRYSRENPLIKLLPKHKEANNGPTQEKHYLQK
ncbi:MAG TPA: hypothetical protein VK766_03540, partial [Cytophagaceae bacterium]|nr:hypothetical protein [Cytophagaceae bacterium]